MSSLSTTRSFAVERQLHLIPNGVASAIVLNGDLNCVPLAAGVALACQVTLAVRRSRDHFVGISAGSGCRGHPHGPKTVTRDSRYGEERSFRVTALVVS